MRGGAGTGQLVYKTAPTINSPTITSCEVDTLVGTKGTELTITQPSRGTDDAAGVGIAIVGDAGGSGGTGNHNGGSITLTPGVGAGTGIAGSIILAGTSLSGTDISKLKETLVEKFVATGGETSHTFTGLSSAKRYRLLTKLQSGNSSSLDFQPNGSATGCNSFQIGMNGSGLMAYYVINGRCCGPLIWDSIGQSEIFPRWEGVSRVQTFTISPAAGNGTRVDYSWGTMTTDFTSLKMACGGGLTLTAGDVLELWEMGGLF